MAYGGNGPRREWPAAGMARGGNGPRREGPAAATPKEPPEPPGPGRGSVRLRQKTGGVVPGLGKGVREHEEGALGTVS